MVASYTMDYTQKLIESFVNCIKKNTHKTCAYLTEYDVKSHVTIESLMQMSLPDSSRFWFVTDLETDMSSLWIVVHMTPENCLMRRCKACIFLASSRRGVSQSVDTRHIYI